MSTRVNTSTGTGAADRVLEDAQSKSEQAKGKTDAAMMGTFNSALGMAGGKPGGAGGTPGVTPPAAPAGGSPTGSATTDAANRTTGS